ncbi:MAG: hypothetical protein JSR89_01520 [Proteobacteria bacterium]|nr:hypothetical protein [Pseudomonadota bacterium]
MSKLITFGGKTQSRTAWAKELGLPISTFAHRLQKCPDKAFVVGRLPTGGGNHGKTHTYKGETHTISEWAALMGCRTCTIRERIKRGAPLDKLPLLKPKPLEHINRPYFSLSKGGFLKDPPTAVALKSVGSNGRGVAQNFSKLSMTGPPSHARDFQPESNTQSSR